MGSLAIKSDLEEKEGLAVWRSILGQQGPEMRLLAEEPEDLSLN